MKILLIYVLLAALTLSMIVTVDILGGESLVGSLRSLDHVFATTTLQEGICIAIFVSLPLINVLTGAYKRSRR
ncbi:hypothetical protein [Paenibacillus tepidiphilus]|uniref:hypothetical protein n=1 Tax=Paenibacillus tepidiphilus TaxID=2608683 RepID=UPI0012391686|nr:hypothetical protein [Paenibacillus tepidiphilus]